MTRASKWLLAGAVGALFGTTIIFVHGIGEIFASPQAAPAPPVIGDKGVLRYSVDAPQLAAIRVEAAEEYPVPLAEPLNGRIAYNENYTARVSSPIAGRVVELHVQPGDSVRAGTALLALDSPDLAAAVSDLDKAEADVSHKGLALKRAKELLEGGVLPRKELESAEADYVQASAETRRAWQRLHNIAPSGAEDGRYQLRAPISGVVAERKVNPAMEVRPDLPDPLFVLTDVLHLWVVIDLPERQLPKVYEGQPVAVEVDAYPGERFAARVEKIGEVVDPATRRIQVRCVIENAAHKLRPEMYARVTLVSSEGRKAIRIPNTAMVTEGLYSYVFVEREPGAFERRQVNLVVQDRDFSYLQEGLASGERIVTSGAVLLNSQLTLSH
jgi:cobalt-zinc-cadmium efflux system membrane fusion protein